PVPPQGIPLDYSGPPRSQPDDNAARECCRASAAGCRNAGAQSDAVGRRVCCRWAGPRCSV
ncbi:hypothetical protein HN747_05125, partial [archaeon]|nr:hypothetical protein [archaeon]